MLIDRKACIEVLRCPRYKSPLKSANDGKLIGHSLHGKETTSYDIIDGLPVLVDFECSLLDKDTVAQSAAASVVRRDRYEFAKSLLRRLTGDGMRATRQNIKTITRLLKQVNSPSRLLVIGGGTIGQGLAPLYKSDEIEIIAFDIYASPNIQFIADAHQIPLPDQYFDAAIVQAVLEHVLQPKQVVDELFRVLKKKGLVYAETPFMQQVHEGPYDFTRFTESGHRYLFRSFDMIESGALGGPAAAFIWSVEYLTRGIFRSHTAGKCAKALLLWMKIFDRIIPERFSIDAASGVFFLGRKSTTNLPKPEIISHYKGAG